MRTFSGELKHLRQAAGLRQQDVVNALGGAVARSQLASVEAGRATPTPALMAAIGAAWPEWVRHLRPYFERELAGGVDAAREWGSPGPYIVERVNHVFNHHGRGSRHEAISIRRIRAMANDAHEFRLTLVDTPRTEPPRVESLWGGRVRIPEREPGDESPPVAAIEFPRPLARGQAHEFAVRLWTEPDDDHSVSVRYALPTDEAKLWLNFYHEQPSRLWSFAAPPGETVPADPRHRREAQITGGSVELDFTKPASDRSYGAVWEW